MIRVQTGLRALLFTVFAGSAYAASTGEPTDLRSALDGALRVYQEQGDAIYPASAALGADSDGAMNWLASPPVLSASYLDSDEPWGTDETELSLTLPFLSPGQRRINSELMSADPALATASEAYRRWQLSGTLRDLSGQYRSAKLALKLARDEADALSDLEARSRPLASAGSLTTLDMWLIGQRQRDAQLAVTGLTARLASLKQVFVRLTGFSDFPASMQESTALPSQPRYHEHPESLFMHALFEQQLAALKAGSSKLTPWTLGIVGRELALADLSERQYGLAISIPIDLGGAETRSIRSGELALRRQFHIQRDSWYLTQRQQWSELWSMREALLAEDRLLQSSHIAEELQLNLENLAMDTEMPVENRVQRRLELLRAQARPAQVAADLASVEARLRQLAGVSL